MRRKIASAVLAAAATLTLGAPAAVAAPSGATADVCEWFPDGPRVTAVRVTKDQAAVHSGPAAACPVGDHLAWYTSINVECKYVNSAGNLWYYTDRAWIVSSYVTSPPLYVPDC
jgi:hypothetical protein